jgi:predicted SnoaL-like aldol condensation-catalyzing enzyme
VEGEHSKEVIRTMVDMFATGDVSTVDAVVAANYVDHQGLRGADIRGSEGFSRVVQAARTALSHLDVTIEDLIAEGDKVAARIHWYGSLPNGETVERETLDIIRVTDGRAVEHWGTQLWSTSGTDSVETEGS